jgi:hypothetical protein
MRRAWLLLTFLCFSSGIAIAQDFDGQDEDSSIDSIASESITSISSESLSDLASGLSRLRDSCAKKALDTRTRFADAEMDSVNNLKLAQQQAEIDSRVYAVGHGRSQTLDYYSRQLQAADDAQRSSHQANSDQYNKNKAEVESCISSARSVGENAYRSFKSNKKNSKNLTSAQYLMAAWLGNLNEINPDQPDGSDATKAEWTRQKSLATVNDL